MTPRQARIASSTFVLLAQASSYNALYMQGDVASARIAGEAHAAARRRRRGPQRNPPARPRTTPSGHKRTALLKPELGQCRRTRRRRCRTRPVPTPFGPYNASSTSAALDRSPATASCGRSRGRPSCPTSTTTVCRSPPRPRKALLTRLVLGAFGGQSVLPVPARCSHRMPRRRSSRFSACWRRAAIVRVRPTAASVSRRRGHPRVRAGSGVGAQGPHFGRCRGPAAEQCDPAEGGRGALTPA